MNQTLTDESKENIQEDVQSYISMVPQALNEAVTGTYYCGGFTNTNQAPVSEFDYLCREHDLVSGPFHSFSDDKVFYDGVVSLYGRSGWTSNRERLAMIAAITYFTGKGWATSIKHKVMSNGTWVAPLVPNTWLNKQRYDQNAVDYYHKQPQRYYKAELETKDQSAAWRPFQERVARMTRGLDNRKYPVYWPRLGRQSVAPRRTSGWIRKRKTSNRRKRGRKVYRKAKRQYKRAYNKRSCK